MPVICFPGLRGAVGQKGDIMVVVVERGPLFDGHGRAGPLAATQESVLRGLQISANPSHSTGRGTARLRHRPVKCHLIEFLWS